MARALVVRVILLAILWWILTEGSISGWIFGVPVTALAAWISLALTPPGTGRFRLRAAPGLAVFFVRESVLGGIDVARRAFHPRLPIAPGFLEYPLRLPTESARVFFSDAVSLLPGTVSVDLRPASIRIHLLDVKMPVEATMRNLEDHVARLLDLELP